MPVSQIFSFISDTLPVLDSWVIFLTAAERSTSTCLFHGADSKNQPVMINVFCSVENRAHGHDLWIWTSVFVHRTYHSPSYFIINMKGFRIKNILHMMLWCSCYLWKSAQLHTAEKTDLCWIAFNVFSETSLNLMLQAERQPAAIRVMLGSAPLSFSEEEANHWDEELKMCCYPEHLTGFSFGCSTRALFLPLIFVLLVLKCGNTLNCILLENVADEQGWCIRGRRAYLPVVLAWAWSRQRQLTRSVFCWSGSSRRQRKTCSWFQSYLNIILMNSRKETHPLKCWCRRFYLSTMFSFTDLIPSIPRALFQVDLGS